MSGGSYEYKYQEINHLADMLSPNKDKWQPVRDRMADALREIAQQCHDIEWIDSGDYGHDEWDDIIQWLDKHNF